MKKIIALLSLTALVSGCAAFPHNPRPLTENATVGRLIAKDTVVELTQDFSFNVFGSRYTLPPGIYTPDFQDDHGIYYKAPSPITKVNGEKTRQLKGGLHLPKEMGRYYSFPSLYVYFDESVRLCGLPNDFMRAQNTMWGIACEELAQPK